MVEYLTDCAIPLSVHEVRLVQIEMTNEYMGLIIRVFRCCMRWLRKTQGNVLLHSVSWSCCGMVVDRAHPSTRDHSLTQLSLTIIQVVCIAALLAAVLSVLC